MTSNTIGKLLGSFNPLPSTATARTQRRQAVLSGPAGLSGAKGTPPKATRPIGLRNATLPPQLDAVSPQASTWRLSSTEAQRMGVSGKVQKLWNHAAGQANPDAPTGVASIQHPAVSPQRRPMMAASRAPAQAAGPSLTKPPQPSAASVATPASSMGARERLKLRFGVKPPQVLPEGRKFTNCASIDPAYKGEETGAVWGTKVTYLNAGEREKYRLTIQDGLFIDSKGRPFDTRDGPTALGGIFAGRGTCMIVMDPDGNFYAKKMPICGKFHHSSFFAGADVPYAGECRIVGGKLKEIDRESGHYKPSVEQLNQAVEAMRRQGVAHEFKVTTELKS